MSLRPWLTGFRARLNHQRSRRLTGNRSSRTEQLEQRTLLTATALVIGTDLTVLTDAAEDVTVQANATTGNAEVLIDGTVLSAGSTVPASLLTGLTIVTGSGDNVVDLSAVTAGVFTSLTSIDVDSGDGDDVIIGTTDLVSTLAGGDGNDSITGGSGAEVMLGGDGQDTIDGGDGNDDINAGDGDDSVTAGAGDDTVTGDDGDDEIFGGAGNDSVLANNGTDSLFGEAGDDTLNGDGGFDSIDGGTGNDTVFGGADNDTLSGGDGDDLLNGQAGDDIANGDAGNDTSLGGGGDDSINGGTGDDILNGNNGRDTLLSGSGNDIAYGGSGNDTILGGEDNDIVRGNSGDDFIIGGGGSDTLRGDTGADFVSSFLGPANAVVSSASVNVSDVTVPEANNGLVTVDFVISLTSLQISAVTVDFNTQDGSAIAGSDYIASNGSLIFQAGETTKNVTIQILDDQLVEGNEQFSLVLTSPTVTLTGMTQASATIIDNDAISSVFDAFPVEPNASGGETPASFRVGGNRWTRTATDGSGLMRGDATTLTWGIVPEGVNIPAFGRGGAGDSNLIAFLDNIYSETATGLDVTNRTWFAIFQSVFDRFGELSGITFVHEPNDTGVAYSNISGSNPGVVGSLPDIRIGGRAIDGNGNVLGFNFFPNNGDMVLDTNDSFFNMIGNNSLLLRNTIAHEIGHGLSFDHVIPVNDTKLMEPNLSRLFDGPQFDDILGLHRQYGDFNESGNGNDTPIVATPLGNIVAGQTVSVGTDGVDTPVAPAETDFISIDGTSDVDVFDFTVAAGSILNVTLTPVGPTYQEGPQGGAATTFDASMRNNLGFEVLDRDGVTVLASLDTSGLGGTEILNGLSLPAEGTYFIRVQGSVDVAQMYQIDAAVTSPVIPPVSPPGAADDLIGDVLVGGDSDDTILGSNGNDSINGGSGDDSIDAGGGNDTVLGGAGRDTIVGGAGDDSLDGQGGADSINGGDDDDEIVYHGNEDGNDTIFGGNGADTVTVNTGVTDDTLAIGQDALGRVMITEGSSTLIVDPSISTVNVNGQAGTDMITVGDLSGVPLSALTVDGGVGPDTIVATSLISGSVRVRLRGGDGNDTITGGVSGDSLFGDAGDDSIDGGAGNDSIQGGDGNDIINTQDGDDTADGEAGNDSITGGLGNDSISGGLDSDTLVGNEGEDTLRGGFGNDNLNGNSGNDSLDGSFGRDSISGGSGDDVADGGRDADLINGQGGNDTIRGDHGADTLNGQEGNDEIVGGDGDDNIMGGAGRDGLAGNDGDDLIQGQGGADTLRGNDGNDTLRGGGSNDTLIGDQGDDTLDGDSGDDLGVTGEGADTTLDLETIDESFILTPFQLTNIDGI